MRCGVLGSLEVRRDDGTLLVVPGAKERLLLAVLAAASPEVVTVDQLHETMWDGAPPPSVRKSLQVHVTRLRGALEPDRPSGSPGRYVARRQRGYALVVPRDRLDATAFEDDVARGRALLAADDPAAAKSLLTRALGRWRGTPYADWPDVPALAPVRARLEGIHAHAIEAFWEAELALGRHVEAVPELERLVAEQPLHEHAWGLLVLALYRGGRQGDALDAVRRARDELRESLGVDPGPELRELEQAVLTQDPGLVTTVGVRTETTSPARSPEPAVSGCPYKGLTRYEVDDAAIFRGRDRLIDALVVTLVDHEIVVVSGSSGAGKSSLVRAGLIPALAAGAVPGSEHWEPVVVVPGPSPVDDLAGLMGEQPRERPVALVCDQLEQLWSSSTPPEERSAFLDTVIGLVEDGVAARCVLVVRGDHVGRLAEHADLAQRISGGGLALVTGMSELELRAVVGEPAEAAGLRVEPDLVDVAVREVIGRPGSLPLLSTALAQTWARRREGTLSLAAYLATGGVSGAVGRSAEQVYSSFSKAERQQARAVLVRLAEQGPDGTVLARRLPVAELEAGEAGTAEVVQTLVDHRLVTRDNDRLEVAHEALLTAWPRLASWLDDDAVGRTVRAHLAPAALEWDAQGRPADELYRGARLQGAAEWIATPDSGATPVERAFVEEGLVHAEAELAAAQERAEVEAAGRRGTRRFAGVLAAVLVLAVASTVVAVIARQRADEQATVADANRLAALSASARSLDLSLLLAVAAVRTADTPATRDSLLEALVEHRRATGVFDLSTERLQETAFAEDGRTLAATVGGAASSILLWQPASGAPPRQFARGWVPDSLTISPEGTLLVGTGPFDGEALTAYRASGEKGRGAQHLRRTGGAPRDVEFTRSGRLMMVTDEAGASGARGTVQRLDLDRGVATPVLSVGRSGSADATLNAAFTDDASAVVVWSSDHRLAYWSRVPDGPPTTLQLRPRAATSLEFIPTSAGALQLWSDGSVTRYDTQGRTAQEITGHRAPVRDAVLLPSGRRAVTVGAEGQVELWTVDRVSGDWSLRESLVGHLGVAEQVEVAPDGQSVLTAARDGEVITWDVSDAGGFGTSYPGLPDRFVSNRVRVVEPGRMVVAPARSRPTNPPPVYAPGLALDHGPGTGSVAAVFWDPRDGRVVDEVPVGRTVTEYIFGSSVAVSPDRRLVAVTSGFATTVLDARTRERIARIPMPQGKLEYATCVAWSPDGSKLLIGTEAFFTRSAGMMVVDTESWEVTPQVVGKASYQVLEWADDGETLVAGVNYRGRLDVYDAALEKVRSVDLGPGGDAWDLAFSPHGSMLAVARDGGGVTVVDTRSWRLVHETAPTHSDHVLDVEWLPDGNTVVSTGVDEVVSMYDVERDLVRAQPLPAAEVLDRGMTFLLTPTSEEFVVLNQDGPGRRYPLDPARWLAKACEVAGRDLTQAEWDRYVPDQPYRPVCEINVGKQSEPR